MLGYKPPPPTPLKCLEEEGGGQGGVVEYRGTSANDSKGFHCIVWWEDDWREG